MTWLVERGLAVELVDWLVEGLLRIEVGLLARFGAACVAAS
jgi:hypothetical protein